MSKEALEAGKHVVCEKPLAMKSSEAAELIEIAKANRLVNAVHFNIRYYPLIHQAKKMIEEGIIGKIFAINGSYQQDWLFFDTDYNWRLEPEFSGDSRAIADIGSHWFDSIEFISGIRINEVFADFATFYKIRKKPLKSIETYSGKLLKHCEYEKKPVDTEDYATVLLHFNNGAHGSVTVNQVAAGRKNRFFFEIYGSKAAIVFNSERPNEIWFGHRERNNEIIMKDPALLYEESRDITSFPGGHNEAFPDTSKQMFTKVYKYIKDKGAEKDIAPGFPTFEAGLRELVLCGAIVKSSRQKKWISTDR
jgi:predicted dehydrogenase